MGIGILEKIFPTKTAVTSSTIRAEIDRSEAEIARLHAVIGPKLAAIATLTDAEHVKVDADIAATKRAIARLDARIAHLNDELPAVIAAEEATAKAEAEAALIKRAETCRKVNMKDGAKLLDLYAEHASAIGDVLDKLKLIKAETEAVNDALRSNPVAETVVGFNTIHRKAPDQIATEHRTLAPHWIYRDAPPQPGEVHSGETEEARLATLDDHGKPIRPGGVQYGRFRQILQPQLEDREVITRQYFRPGRTEPSLDEVRLPPAFSGGQWAWPRP